MALFSLAREKMRTYTLTKSVTRSMDNLIPVPTLLSDPPPAYDSHPCNVIIFGETGAGKSSVVNMIAGRKVAYTSPDAGACTFSSTPYPVVLSSNRPFIVWDTVGLNEPNISQEDYLRSIKQAYKLVKSLEHSGGVHLLLLCVRGRLTKSVEQNYKLFVNILCDKKVPLAVVVTNLENEPDMEGWWTANKDVFERHGISPDGHACITANPGPGDVFLSRYKESAKTMRQLLLELTSSSGEGWRKENRAWLINLLGKMARMLRVSPRHGRSAVLTSQQLTVKLVKECGFSKNDASAIATSIIEISRDQKASDSNGGPLSN